MDVEGGFGTRGAGGYPVPPSGFSLVTGIWLVVSGHVPVCRERVGARGDVERGIAWVPWSTGRVISMGRHGTSGAEAAQTAGPSARSRSTRPPRCRDGPRPAAVDHHHPDAAAARSPFPPVVPSLGSLARQLIILEVAGLLKPVPSASAWRLCLGLMVANLHLVLPLLLAYACLGEVGLNR